MQTKVSCQYSNKLKFITQERESQIRSRYGKAPWVLSFISLFICRLVKERSKVCGPHTPRHRKNATDASAEKQASRTHSGPGPRVIMSLLPRPVIRAQFFSLGNGGRLIFWSFKTMD